MVELVLGTRRGRLVAQRIQDPAATLHSPCLLDVEVAQAIRRYVRSQQVSPDRGRKAIELLRAFDATRYPHDVLLPRIWSLRDNLSAYDAAYVSLAEALSCPLVTTDRKFRRGPGAHIEIEVI